jgi:magnesium chelatase subunit I
VAAWAKQEAATRRQLLAARRLLPRVQVPDDALEAATKLCLALGTDGLRGELTLMRTARALAAFEGERVVTVAHLRRIAAPALRHRLRRDPLDEAVAGTRVERALAEVLPP